MKGMVERRREINQALGPLCVTLQIFSQGYHKGPNWKFLGKRDITDRKQLVLTELTTPSVTSKTLR